MTKKKDQWKNRIVGEGIISADQLKANPKNWRTHGDDQRKTMDSVLDEIGWIQRVIVNKTTGNIVDGHLRVEQALAKGEDVPVLYVELSKEEEILALATIDPIGAMAGSDQGMVNEIIELVNTEDESILELIDSLRDEPLKKLGKTDPDDVPEVPEKPITKLGDIWCLGHHRLMCGDSTDLESVEKLMDGQKADMVFTDPPYGIDIVQGTSVGGGKLAPVGSYSPVIGDDTTQTAIDSYQLCEKLDIKKLIFWGGNYYADNLPASSCWIIWDKENTGNFADAELAWTNFKTSVRIFKHQWNGMIKASERGEKRVHPTQKPVALAEWCFNQYGKDNDFVLDLFGGSGSTLIACESTNRHARLMELDEKYCDVIIKRWQGYTGNEAVHEDGRLYNDLVE